MSNVATHYEQLLARTLRLDVPACPEQKVAEQKKSAPAIRLLVLCRPRRRPAPPVDLGSGPGFQSIALAELGYSPVIAVDSSRELLGDLQARKQSYEIETRGADITQARLGRSSRKCISHRVHG